MYEGKLQKIATKRLLVFPISAGIILLFTVLWHFAYNRTVNAINAIQIVLTNASGDVPKEMPSLADLNVLSDILKHINQSKIARYRWIGLGQGYRIYKITDAQYRTVLHSKFTAYLKSTLVLHIQKGLGGNKLALFDALKVYLTITSPLHYDKNVIMSWYRRYWELIYPNNPVLVGRLQKHLYSLLQLKSRLWGADVILVQRVQEALQALSLPDLAFLELQGEYEPVDVPIFPKSVIAGVSLKNAKVSAFYSSENFKEIYKQKIPHIKSILAKGSWVLGAQKKTVVTAQEEAKLAEKVRSIYLKFYAAEWAKSLAYIQLTPEKTLSEVQAAIKEILDSDSQLMPADLSLYYHA